jgi:hypothetical protein
MESLIYVPVLLTEEGSSVLPVEPGEGTIEKAEERVLYWQKLGFTAFVATLEIPEA